MRWRCSVSANLIWADANLTVCSSSRCRPDYLFIPQCTRTYFTSLISRRRGTATLLACCAHSEHSFAFKEDFNERHCLSVGGCSGDSGCRVGTSRSRRSASARRQSGQRDPSAVLLAWTPLGSLRMAAPPSALLVTQPHSSCTRTAAGTVAVRMILSVSWRSLRISHLLLYLLPAHSCWKSDYLFI